MPIVRYNDATIGFPDDMPPEEVQGVLGRAFSNFARDIDTAKTHLSRLAEGSVIVGAVRGMRPEDQAALATSMVPGVGDAAGLYADYTDIRENWDQVPWYDKAGMVGAAALGAVPFVPSRSQLHAGAEIAREKIKAYHGSPHDFDKFTTEAIGTGEGAQAYGHGLYFAESEDVAKGYRDTLTPRDLDYEEELLRRYNALERSGNYEKMEMYEKAMLNDTPADFRDIASDLDYDDDYRQMAADMADEIEELAPDLGAMYQVEIDASPDEFLDWDLPLSQQSEGVRKNMETLGFTDNKKAVNDFDNALLDNLFNDSSKPLPKQPSDLRGEHLYYQSAPKATNPAEASNVLSGLGIKGIRYKDANSRGKEGGTSNYVVFDENLISIARKYGIAIPAAAAMLARQTGQNPQDLYEDDSGA